MGARSGGGGRGDYAGLNRAQKIAVNRALSNAKFNGSDWRWTKDSAARDLLQHWGHHKQEVSKKLGRPATDMEVMESVSKYWVNHKTGDFFGWK